MDNLSERIDKLQARMEALMMEGDNQSPNRDQTQIINEHDFLGVHNHPTMATELLASIAALKTPGLRKLACKDLAELFESASNVVDTGVTSTLVRTQKQTFNSPTMKARGPKECRGDMQPVREGNLTPCEGRNPTCKNAKARVCKGGECENKQQSTSLRWIHIGLHLHIQYLVHVNHTCK